MTTAYTYVDRDQQVRRSIELLDRALTTLREDSFGSGVSLAAVADRVEEAKTKIASALNPGCPEYKECVVSGKTILNETLRYARALDGISPRQEESLNAIARAHAILLLVIHRITSTDAQAQSHQQPRAEKKVQLPTGEQRRKHTRVELETEVTFEGPSNFYTGFTEDISEGGLFMSTYDIRPLGTKVEISFSLPSGHVVNAVGEVRWVRDPVDPDEDSLPGMGIMFNELLPEDRAAVEAFIKSRSPMFFDE
jgi:uncharacterized protein (TIGR02266 family)